MPKHVEIEIKEGIDYLKKLRKEESNHRLKTRIQSLILTKENKFPRRLDLATYLGIGIASLDRWTRVYKESGRFYVDHFQRWKTKGQCSRGSS